MALLNPFTTPHGAPTNYHRLIKADYDCIAQAVTLTFQVYVSPEARDSGAMPLWHEHVVVPFADLPEDPRKALYPMAAGFAPGYLAGATGDEPAP